LQSQETNTDLKLNFKLSETNFGCSNPMQSVIQSVYVGMSFGQAKYSVGVIIICAKCKTFRW